MNKPVYLSLSIIDLSKTVVYEFWYDYLKPKYSENSKLCYMDTGSFIVHVKTNDNYKDIAEDVETRFDTSNLELDRTLPKGKNKKVIGLMKEELPEEIMKKFVGLRAKAYSYLKENNNNEDKEAKGTKKCVCVMLLKTQEIFRSEKHNVFTEEINKIALSSNDDNRMQSTDLTETYSYGMNKNLEFKKEKIIIL